MDQEERVALSTFPGKSQHTALKCQAAGVEKPGEPVLEDASEVSAGTPPTVCEHRVLTAAAFEASAPVRSHRGPSEPLSGEWAGSSWGPNSQLRGNAGSRALEPSGGAESKQSSLHLDLTS